MQKVRWGILSSANIAIQKVIPAMQQGKYCDIAAIASRTIGTARAAAAKLNIPKAYGSYQELLDDPDIDAVYIPLPNHLHVPWAIKALEAGKHVLCEKPVALTVTEAQYLLETSLNYPHLKLMEAFMYKFHPQWIEAKRLVDEGRIGQLRTIQCFFSYFNNDPANIRNIKEIGGGGLMDIGCYCISQSRYIFGSEPTSAMGLTEYDPVMGTDRMASAILKFSSGTASFTCSTQLSPYQRVNILGTEGRIELEIPVNAIPDQPSRIWLQTSGAPQEILIEACNQYTLQGDAFSKAIIEGTAIPVSLEDSINNLKIIELIKAEDRSI